MFRDNIKSMVSFFKLVKGNRFWILFLFLGSIVGHFTELLIPIFVSNIIYYVTDLNSYQTFLNIGFLAVTYFFYNAFWYLNYVSYSYNFRYSYQSIRERIIKQIFTYDIDFTEKISKGTVLNTVSEDVGNLSEMIDCICEIMIVSVKVIVMFIIFFMTNWLVFLFILLLECLYLKTFDYCNVKSTKYLLSQEKYRDKLTDNLSQILNGLKEIKLFHIFEQIYQNFLVISNKWADQYIKKRKYADIRESLLPFIIHMGKVLLYFVLSCFVLKGYYKVNTLILLVSYFETLMEDTEEFMGYSRQIREWSVSISRIHSLLNYSSRNQFLFGEKDHDSICGVVQFKNVSFQYKSKNKGSIQHLSFVAKPNQITAIVGASGSGKTTILNLLLRHYKVDQGSILIDSVSIYEYSKKAYSKNLVGVNQSPFLFHMSIRHNLNLIDKNVKRQEEACKRVGIHDYIMSLPKGYHTILDENGSNFSGGQKQLLSIARVLLSKAEILVFDEVTSSLDPLLVDKVKEIFEDLKQDHTILLITHKKDIMCLADQIIVLQYGKIVGQGTHEDLLLQNPYYIELQKHNYSSIKKSFES